MIEIQYFPPIPCLALFAQYETVYIECWENYQKGSYRNRCYILSPQGRQLLSVPLLKGKHQQLPISDVEIAYHMPWYAHHWHAIQTAYGSAPYFIHYKDEIETILYSGEKSLYKLNKAIIGWLLKQFGLPGSLKETQSFIEPSVQRCNDLRNSIRPQDAYTNPRYPQVFEESLGFIANLSSLDLLMHLGPEGYDYLSQLNLAN